MSARFPLSGLFAAVSLTLCAVCTSLIEIPFEFSFAWFVGTVVISRRLRNI